MEETSNKQFIIMAKIRLTKEFGFEMAHALNGYDGACKHIHGHSYKLFVTICGSPNEDINSPKYGMVVDFKDLKNIVNTFIIERYDHALVLMDVPEKRDLYDDMKKVYSKIVLTDYQPTCENMISRFAEDISAALPEGVELHHIKMHETATSYAEWYAEDNKLEGKK